VKPSSASGSLPLEKLWTRFSALPGGRRIFSALVGWIVPYSGSVSPRVEELRPGYARIHMQDRRTVRNHLSSIHAIALMNLGEMVTGVALITSLPHSLPKGQSGRAILTKLSMDYLKKARGRITAECVFTQEAVTQALQSEPPLITLNAQLKDKQGQVVATATAVWKVQG
jgi:acyl-coenzyme A thioesterase PaaI-like protein